MPIEFTALTAFKSAQQLLTQLEKDSKFATRTATTKVAVEARKNLSNELKDRLDAPTPFFTSAYKFTPARDLEKPVARVFVHNDDAFEFIDSISKTGKNIPGGLAKFAKREGLTRGSEVVVPTRFFRKQFNKAGNLSTARAKKIINSDKTVVLTRKKSPKWFGIYTGSGKKFKQILRVAKPKPYKPPILLEKPVEKASQQFDKFYNAAFTKNRNKTLRKQVPRLLKPSF